MHRRSSFIAGLIAFVALLVASVPAGVAEAQGQRCFPETGQCIAGSIRTYWERNGGLPVFGFPITAQNVETVEGRQLQVQWFERDRLEIQPDGRVTTGRLGVERLDQLGAPWQRGNKASADSGCIAFPAETGHQVCGAFAQYWRNNGGINRFGLPITAEVQTQIQGQSLTVQYFERRRFELHGSGVLLGLLGREVLDGRNAPPPPPTDPCTQIPANVNAEINPKCAPWGTVFAAGGVGFSPGENVGAYITAPDQSVLGARFQLEADDSGSACCVTFDSSFLPRDERIDGIWAITFEGVESRRVAIAYFRVLR